MIMSGAASTSNARVITPNANTRGQTGIAGKRDRSLSHASMKALAKQVGQSGQEVDVERQGGSQSTLRSPNLNLAPAPAGKEE